MKLKKPLWYLLIGGALLLLFFLLFNTQENPVVIPPQDFNVAAVHDSAPAVDILPLNTEAVERKVIAAEKRTLQLAWYKAVGDEVPEDILVQGWDSKGVSFSARSDKLGRIRLPEGADSLLLLVGLEGNAVGGIFRVIFRDSKFEESVDIFKTADLRVQLVGDMGEAIPEVNVGILFPAINGEKSLVVPTSRLPNGQTSKYSKFVALLVNHGAKLPKNISSKEISKAIGELSKELKGSFVDKIVDMTPNSAFIGFPYIEPHLKQSDKDGYATWQNLPANLELRYLVVSDGMFVPAPQPDDKFALDKIVHDTEKLQYFSGVFKLAPDEDKTLLCRVVTGTSVAGQLPLSAAQAESVNLGLWAVSKAHMGLDSGTSSITLESYLDLDSRARFYKVPVVPGYKRVTATWHSSSEHAHFAYKNFFHPLGEQIDLGLIEEQETADVVFKLVPEMSDVLTPSEIIRITDELSTMQFDWTISGEYKTGAPTFFVTIPANGEMRLSGLPLGSQDLFARPNTGQLSMADGRRCRWSVEQRTRFEVPSSSEVVVKIPIVFGEPTSEIKIIASPAPGAALAQKGYSVGIYDLNGEIVLRKSVKSILDSQLVVDCELSPGSYKLVFLPRQGRFPSEDMSLRIAGGIIENVLVESGVDSVVIEIPAGLNLAGNVAYAVEGPAKKGKIVGLVIGNPQHKGVDIYGGNPSTVIPILNDEGQFRIFGIPAASTFLGGGHGKYFYFETGNQDMLGIKTQSFRH